MKILNVRRRVVAVVSAAVLLLAGGAVAYAGGGMLPGSDLSLAAAPAVAVPNPDPCDSLWRNTWRGQRDYLDCRSDRIEKAIPGATVPTPDTCDAMYAANHRGFRDYEDCRLTRIESKMPGATPTSTTSTTTQPTTTTSTSTTSTTTQPTTTTSTTTTPVGCTGAPNTPGGPDPYGGCWPGPLTTGVADCPALTVQTGDVVAASGDVIENKEIRGQLRFANGAKNVTVRCVKVVWGGWFPIDTERSGYDSAGDVLLERVEVDCQGSADSSAAMLLFGTTVKRSKATNCLDAYRWASEVVIEDSYCGGLNSSAGNDPHYDCAQTSGANNVVIRHNTLDGRDTSDVAIWPDLGPVDNVTVDRNLLIGTPGYRIYVGKNSRPDPVTNITIRDNRLSRGGWGPCSIENSDPVWEGNVYNDTGESIPRSAC